MKFFTPYGLSTASIKKNVSDILQLEWREYCLLHGLKIHYLDFAEMPLQVKMVAHIMIYALYSLTGQQDRHKRMGRNRHFCRRQHNHVTLPNYDVIRALSLAYITIFPSQNHQKMREGRIIEYRLEFYFAGLSADLTYQMRKQPARTRSSWSSMTSS